MEGYLLIVLIVLILGLFVFKGLILKSVSFRKRDKKGRYTAKFDRFYQIGNSLIPKKILKISLYIFILLCLLADLYWYFVIR